MTIQFKLAPSDSFKTDVRVAFRGDFGTTKHLNIKAEFRRLPHDQLRVLGQRLEDPDNEDADAQIVRDNLIGWETFKDFAGNDVEFGEVALREVLNVTEFRRALVKAFLSSLSDPEATNRKN